MDVKAEIIDEAALVRMLADFTGEGIEAPTIEQLLSGESPIGEFVSFHREVFGPEDESAENSEEEFIHASFSTTSTEKKQEISKKNSQLEQVQHAGRAIVFPPYKIDDPAVSSAPNFHPQHVQLGTVPVVVGPYDAYILAERERYIQRVLAQAHQPPPIQVAANHPLVMPQDALERARIVMQMMAAKGQINDHANRLLDHLQSKSSIDIFRDLLFVASHQRRYRGEMDLIDIDCFSGKAIDLQKSLLNEDICIAVSVDHRPELTYRINNNETAKKRLYELSPVVKLLVEKGAFADGTICIGGGAAMWAVRECDTEERMRNGSGDHLPEDVDFFIVSGPSDKDKYGKVCVSTREAIAQKIYETFLMTIDSVYRQSYSESHSLLIMRNKDCTTIILTPKQFTENNRYAGLRQAAKRRQIKLQIIHRLYSYLAEVPKGFDLAASQFVFNGDKFYSTYAGMISASTSVIPLDVSRASKSWAMRLWKYSREKNFQLAFMGINKVDIQAKLKPKKRIYFDCGFSLKNLHNGADGRQLIYSIIDKKMNDKLSAFSSGHNRIDWAEIASTDYEFGTHKCVKDLEDVTVANLDAVLKGVSIYATSAWESFENSSRSSPLSQIQSFLQDEVVLTESIDDVFTDRCYTKSSIKRDDFILLFGPHASAAGACYYDEDQHGYEEIVGTRLSDILVEMESQIEILKKITWKVISPGDQEYGQIHHIDLTARSFYGDLYNGFNASNMWISKLPIIIAMRRRGTSKAEKNCPLVEKLPRDIIKMIFFWVDHLTIRDLVSGFIR